VAGNHISCVLSITGPGGKTLLVGDIVKKREGCLLAMEPDLHGDLLIATHHDRNLSSTLPFVAAVAPRAVWFR
jgi:competence protein ComEC